MPAPTSTEWPIEPHTRAKHEILRRYLQAWVPILGRGGFPEVVYIDGFAGPGRYLEGEDGSPIIALKAALEQQNRIRLRITFLFVELIRKRADTLRSILRDFNGPSDFSVTVAGDKAPEIGFDVVVTSFIDDRTRGGRILPPTFAFIDPFGWGGVPFELVRRVLSFPSCEVMVTFMYEELNRFIGHPDQEENFNSFFGTEAWHPITSLRVPRERNRQLHDLYVRQLRESAGARYVRSFEMRNERDVTDYFLFYATNSLLGLKKMKEAMWRVDKSGSFRFSDATNPLQMVLFGNEPQFDVLRSLILDKFQGQETTIGEIEEFVVSETAFRETHYKKQILRPLELSRPPVLVAIDPPAGRKPGTYGDSSLRVRFTQPSLF